MDGQALEYGKREQAHDQSPLIVVAATHSGVSNEVPATGCT
jgi:hypothetical protein